MNCSVHTGKEVPVALSIAGSDSCAGAGIQADLKTFQAHGVYGLSAITAVTAQNTQGVYAVQEIDPEIVRKQILCLFQDMRIDAVKIGMVSSAEIIRAVAQVLREKGPKALVLDPVMVSKSGHELLKPQARQALQQELIPLADLITPNLQEAEVLLGRKIASLEEMEGAATELGRLGAARGVLKGGHLEGCQAVDIYYEGENLEYLQSEFIVTRNTHGTGCTFSSAIAACLARGCSWLQAVQQAKEYVHLAIKHALTLGQGHGPTNHFFRFFQPNGFESARQGKRDDKYKKGERDAG
ncbi:MAG: bifunctional hydroxymethylpyrimidine kinase/phosphomethylpyrimidine kinase [Desulfohalobiaceae bacterium]